MANWDAFQDLQLVRRYLDRLTEEFDGWRWPFSRVSFLPARAARQYPLINLAEDADAYYVEALAPGVDPEGLKLSVHQNTLVIEGEKLASGKGLKPEAFHRSERAAGRFIRSIELPMGIDATKVTADYTNGLLMVTLPKMEQVKPRQIDVTIG